MTREDVPPLLTLSGVVPKAQRDRVGHITSSDRCRRPVGREKKKKPGCLIFGTRTIPYYSSGSRGFEMLPPETYILKKFLAADSSGCLFCHNRDKAPPAFEP